MRKYKMMALTGILLSSTILGANTSLVQAADNSSSGSAASPIRVINTLGNLLTSSKNTINPQTKFSTLADGSTLKVAPIFGDGNTTTFDNTLQSELNVVDDSNQLVPMKVVSRDDTTGFVKQASYTVDGTTKTITVDYSYAMPRVSLDDNSVLNYKSSDFTDNKDAIDAKTINKKSVTVTSDNGTDAKGHSNSKDVEVSGTVDPKNVGSNKITFTPKDSYKTAGIPASRVVNVYDLSKDNSAWANVLKSYKDEDSLKQDRILVDESSKQIYSVHASNITQDADGKGAHADFTATAIKADGSTINDSLDNVTPITFSNKDVEVNYNSEVAGIIVLNNVNNGKLVSTIPVSGAQTSDQVSAAATKAGYNVKTPSAYDPSKEGATKSYTVDKSVTTHINYIDTTTGQKVGNGEDLDGLDGEKEVIKGLPANYELETATDLIQTMDASQKTKDIYVTPISNNLQNLSYTATFKDKSGNTVGTEVKNTGAFGNYIALTAPTGYTFSTIADRGFLLYKNGQTFTSYVVKDDTPYNISYVDQDTKKEVGTQAGKGADGSEVTLTAPDGYTFINANDVTYKISANTTSSTIYVKKSDAAVDNLVATYPDKGQYVKIYDADGNLNDSVVLSAGTSWIIDQTREINGEKMYRVATNEYIKASDAYRYVPLQQVVTTKSGNIKPVYNSKGQLVLDLALDYNTPWYTDRSATINGEKMYRVATDEWVRAADVNEG